jgi:hypothetical protein
MQQYLCQHSVCNTRAERFFQISRRPSADTKIGGDALVPVFECLVGRDIGRTIAWHLYVEPRCFQALDNAPTFLIFQ